MNIQTILSAIQAAVGLRNQIQTALAADAHVLPAAPAVAATATTPAVAAAPAQPTGQLPTAASYAHQLANLLKHHLENITDDEAVLKEAAAIIAKVPAVPAPVADTTSKIADAIIAGATAPDSPADQAAAARAKPATEVETT